MTNMEGKEAVEQMIGKFMEKKLNKQTQHVKSVVKSNIKVETAEMEKMLER